jgi:4-carboxymuconolactone decarboxylase
MTTQQVDWREEIPELWGLTQDMLFGQIWERTPISKRDRSLITVAALTALYRTDQLRSHVNRALDNGVTPDELKEVMIHLSFYSGWPTGVNGGQVVAEELEKRGLN